MDNIELRSGALEDNRAFNALLTNCGGLPLYRAIFGQFTFSAIVEYSLMTIAGIRGTGDDSECFSFLAVNDSTSCSSDADSFSTTLNELNQLVDVQVTNTLFINFWIIDENYRYSRDLEKKMITKLFSENPDVDFFVWLCPSKARVSDSMSRLFKTLDLTKRPIIPEVDPLEGFSALMLFRSDYLPVLHVRQARVEDNDDLLPILESNSPQLLYGQEDFFLADLIASQDERNQFFVGVSKGNVVGMLATSLDVNVGLISKIFEIELFSDIIVAKEEKPLPFPEIVGLIGDQRLFKKFDISELVSQLNCLLIDAEIILSSVVPSPSLSEEQSANQAIEVLSDHIRSMLSHPDRQGKKVPVACVVMGFPRTDEEAVAISQRKFVFDAILELNNHSEIQDLDDEPFLQAHLDAVETLRQLADEFSHKPEHAIDMSRWRKTRFDKNNERELLIELSKSIEPRTRELDLQRKKEQERPPEANAFAITVFAIDEVYQSRAEDMLRIAFEENMSLSYAVFMVPCNCKPSRLTDSMILAPVRTGVSFDQCLYILHREVLVTRRLIRVERLQEPLLADVIKFIRPLDTDKEEVLRICSAGVRENDVELKDNPADVCFSVYMKSQMIGLVALSRKLLSSDEVNWLRANYRVDDFASQEKHRLRAQAYITQWITDPLFAHWSKFIIREAMRMYRKTLLYYLANKEIPAPKEILNNLVPIPPRCRMQPIRGDQSTVPLLIRPTIGVQSVDSPLYCISKSQLQWRKETISTRILVVGGNSAAFSILETLCLAPSLNIPCITLVDENPHSALLAKKYSTGPHAGEPVGADIPSTSEVIPVSDKFEGSECFGCLSPKDADLPTEREIDAMGLAHKITIVKGKITDIDRENRAVVISDEVVIEYDILVLSAGTQDNSVKRFPGTKGLHPSTCLEKGVFGLGTKLADSLALQWVLDRNGPANRSVIVCGLAIDCLVAAGNLLKFGVDADRLTLIIQEDQIDDFAHPNIVNTILVEIQKLGLKIYWGHAVVDVEFSSRGKIETVLIRPVQVQKKKGVKSKKDGESKVDEKSAPNLSEAQVLACASLLCCGIKSCDADMFSAVNDSGLVYDGGLVVDECFRTVDPYIYAVGDFTKYSRIYTDVTPHQRYNKKEVGKYLANVLIARHLDPLSPLVDFTRPSTTPMGAGGKHSMGVDATQISVSKYPAVAAEDLPVFKLPRTLYLILPGDLLVVRSALPVTSVFDTSELVTGETSADRVTVVQVDNLGTVVEIICIGRGRVEERNIGRLVGWHESFLNSAITAYDNGRVEDWIDFFRESWVTAVLHDKFSDLAATMRGSLQTDNGAFIIVESVVDSAESTGDDTIVSEARRQLIGEGGSNLPSLTKKTIQDLGMEFLQRNKIELTRFYVPSFEQSKN